MRIDTSNQYGVGSNSGGEIQVTLHRLLSANQGRLSRDEALVFCAWLLVLSDPASASLIAGEDTRFGEIVQTILNS